MNLHKNAEFVTFQELLDSQPAILSDKKGPTEMFIVFGENSQHGLLQHMYEFSSGYALLFRVVILHNLCKFYGAQRSTIKSRINTMHTLDIF